ncbi:ArsR/SmtB family transcription factor [Aminobacter aganoensis]|uniref:DNA-binding transcriptional ArsR family regulator n=1 Tax=Aminobacter aganoensis TaxID=83264 RepID=A0A7X0F551_9HYPH|nr:MULTISPECIES: metalloregulator ArsR/SmtB family transcription factor [Aminobacter]KQU65681.1 ArsR family transcriptional regulator [Aminobacter sp. DSM 101952]MBB6353276.1 DNA-binding transcriptional ArsR family regulator [Aminobacter aganoensis]
MKTFPLPQNCAASAEDVAQKLAALSHPARLAILRRLGGGRSCCCKEVVEHLDLAQSTVSQHLKILVEAGLVRYAPERQRSRYQIDPAALAAVSASVSALVESCCADEGADI